MQQPADNTNRHFKGQQAKEIVLCFTRRHWILLVPQLIGFIFAGLLVLSFFFIPHATLADSVSPFTYRVMIFIIITGVGIWYHLFFLTVFNFYLQIIVVTNFRVVHLDQTLFFKHTLDSIDLAEIQDVSAEQTGLFKTLLNYGEVMITLSSVYASKVFRYMPNPTYYFSKINKTKQEYITARQVQKQPPPPASPPSGTIIL